MNLKDYDLDETLPDNIIVDFYEIESDNIPMCKMNAVTIGDIYFIARAASIDSILTTLAGDSDYIDVTLNNDIIVLNEEELLEQIRAFNEKEENKSNQILGNSLIDKFRNFCTATHMSGVNDLNFEWHNFLTPKSQKFVAYGRNFFDVWLWIIAEDYETLKNKMCDFIEQSGVVIEFQE